MRISTIIPIAFFLLLALSPVFTFAQCGSIQGMATALTGETKNYSYCYSSQTFVSPIWTVTKGTVLSTSLSSDATTAYATIRWDVQGTGTVALRDGVVLQTRNITITCSTIGSPSFLPTAPYVCGSGTATLTSTSGSGGNSVKYYNALTGGTLLQTGGSYTTPTISTTTSYYIVSYNSTSTCESSPRTQATVTVSTIPSVPATTTPGTTCNGYGAVLAATPGANGTQIKWFDAATNGNLLYTGNSFTTPALTTSTTFYAATYNAAGTCSSTRTPVLATVVTGPSSAQGMVDDVIYGAGTLTIGITPGEGGNSIRWYLVETGGTSIAQGTTFTTPVLTATKTYYVSTFSSTLNCESATRIPVTVTVIPLISASSLKQVSVRIAGVKTEDQLLPLTNAQKNVQISYFDGLLRANQRIVQSTSPSGADIDIVQPIEFDSYGRRSKSYLPYVDVAATGTYKSAYKFDQIAFYNKTTDKVADDSKPYALARFESSPIGRVVEQGGVGSALQPDGGHTQKVKYSYNNGAINDVAEEVRFFKLDGTSSGFYGANLLTRTEGADADGNIQIVFADKAGRIIVKKQQLGETINGATVNYLETYYIYDDFDRVKYIISPKGVAALKSGSWSLTQSILDQYVHQFVYDSRGRLIEKKVPGQAWMYYAYDKLNRVVLTQDGLLKASNKWMFVKYDSKGRTVMQGLYLNATQNTRATIQVLLDSLYKTTNATYPVNAYYESRGTTLHGYTNTSFPKLNADNSALEVWNVMYFESHDFDFNGSRDFKYDSLSYSGSGQAATSNWRARGLATGSKRLVLGTTTWLYTYVYYDKYNRPIQVRSNNHLSAAVDNVATTVYDFEGKVLTTKIYHNAGGGKITTVLNQYTYDSKGRLKKVEQKNNAAANYQLVAQYEYNELGQVVDKKLHETALGNQTFLQSVDYRYTIRGQLSSINNAALNVNTASNDETNDYFGMEFVYNTLESGLSNNAYFNGNISAVKWKGIGAGTGTTDQKSYKFTYDKSNKLKATASQLYTGSAWTKEAGAMDESMSYDHNGNIKTLQRNQRKHQLVGVVASYVSEPIDNLTYNYSPTIGDQLLKVEDAVTGTPGKAGFDNGTTGTNSDYTYDANGNLLTDQNKTITSNITYNVLGKPTLITYTDGRKLEYVYDASGSKITMKSYGIGGSPITTTDYVGGFVYENNVLSFFGSPEGRVVNNNNTLEYQYAIADHQGNTRVVFSSVTPLADAPIATFEGDANDGAGQYINGGLNIVSFGSANHTSAGSKVVRMNQSNKIGPARSVKVYPGDKVDIEVWEYHEGGSGYGTTGTALNNLITSVVGAFTGVVVPTEVGAMTTGVNNALTIFGTGGNQGDARPAAYLNYILFDKNYNVLDAGWQLAPVTTFTKQKISFPTKDIKEEGYVYTWLSYDDASNNYVYFDDFKVTHNKSNVVQYNEYYPFGLQTSNSWTRTNSTNNFLYNSANELNKTSGWYEMFYRGYDPSIGRMLQVDPYATSYSDHTPYNYALNNPGMLNDPSGGYTAQYANNFGREISNRINSWFESNGALDFDTYTGNGPSGAGSGMYIDHHFSSMSGRNGIVGDLVIDLDQLPEDSETVISFANGGVASVAQGNFTTGSLIISFLTTPDFFSQTGWGEVGKANDLEGAYKIAQNFKRNGVELKNLVLFSHGAGGGAELHFGEDNLRSDQYEMGNQAYTWFNILLDEVAADGNVVLIGCRAGMEITGIGNVMQYDIRCDINVYVNSELSNGREERDGYIVNWETFWMYPYPNDKMLSGPTWWNLQTGQKGLTVLVNVDGTITVK